MKTVALIVAGGSSVRFGGETPKQFREVAGRPLLSWTISRFEQASKVDQIFVVVAEEYLLHTGQRVIDPYGFPKVTKVVIGGAERQESVRRGLEALPISTSLVAIHDGARPLTRPSDIDRVVELAAKERAAMLASPITDAVKRVREGFVLASIDRGGLYGAQTPQVFQYDLILAAHREAADSEKPFADDSSVVEARGFKVCVVEPSGPNMKVTTRDDLKIVEALLAKENHG